MKYQPDRYVCKITVRKDNYRPPETRFNPTPLFNTWQEAHEWLVIDRRHKVVVAKNNLAVADKALKRALKLEGRPMPAQPKESIEAGCDYYEWLARIYMEGAE